MLKIGTKAPDFRLKDQNGDERSLSEFRGHPLVVYFYPKDETAVCTKEACAFRDAYEDFKDAGAEVIGISSDAVASHKNFAANRNLPFILLSDPDGSVRAAYDAKGFLGILQGRVTYVIDKNGVIIHAFSSLLSHARHVRQALAALKSWWQFESL